MENVEKKTMNVIVVLGAVVVKQDSGVWTPSQHLQTRLDAAGQLFGSSKGNLFLVLTGGYNVGVRYRADGTLIPVPVLGLIFEPDDFARARFEGN
jgi:vancomycin permeability regulator SanA